MLTLSYKFDHIIIAAVVNHNDKLSKVIKKRNNQTMQKSMREKNTIVLKGT